MSRPGILTTAAIVLPLAGAAVGLVIGIWREHSLAHALDSLSEDT